MSLSPASKLSKHLAQSVGNLSSHQSGYNAVNFSFFYIIKYTGDRQTFCQTYQQIHAISGLRDMCRHGSDLSDLHYCPLVYLRVEQIGKLHNNLLFNVEWLDA